MSLKKFHICFIAISSLLCLFLIFWGIWFFKSLGELKGLMVAGVGAAGTALLFGYLKWFLKKYPKLLSVAFGVLAGGLYFFRPELIMACAVCYREPDTLMAKGAVSGVWFLLAVIVSVLLSIVLVARSWLKKAKSLNVPL